MQTLILSKAAQQANGRQPITITADGTPGELKDAESGDKVRSVWCDKSEYIIGLDGRLWLVVEEK